MIIFSYIQILLIFLIFSNTFIRLNAQNNEGQVFLERKADSLANLEKHEEAVGIYQTILKNRGQELDPLSRNRLEYKTGISLINLGREISAMSYFNRIVANQDNLAGNELIVDAMTGLGNAYEYKGKHDSAFLWYLKSYRLISESDDTLRRARGLRNMAQLLRVLRRLNEAKAYLKEAIELIPGIDDYKALANIYNETAYLFELSVELDSAGYYYRQLIDVSKKNNYLKGESVGYNNLASVYEKQKRYKEALVLKFQGLEIDREIKDNYGLMTSYKSISTTYFLMKEYQKALDALRNAIELCDTSWLPDLSGIRFQYYELFKAIGNYPKALENYEEHIALRNRINKAESSQKVDELLARYESEKSEQQIQLLEQSNLLKANSIRIQWIFIGILFLFGLFLITTGLYWLRDNNRKMKQMNIELQHLLYREKHEQCRIEDHIEANPAEIYKQWGLTDRESEILYHLSKGCSNSKISEQLFVSENTVKFHIKNIYIKLDVKNRIQALIRCNHNH